MTQAMECAAATAKWLAKKKVHTDVAIYVDHKRYHINDDGSLEYDIDAEPKKYFEFAGDFMSMSFEGPLYAEFNYTFDSKVVKGLNKIFTKYNKWYDLGDAWNLSLYDL